MNGYGWVLLSCQPQCALSTTRLWPTVYNYVFPCDSTLNIQTNNSIILSVFYSLYAIHSLPSLFQLSLSLWPLSVLFCSISLCSVCKVWYFFNCAEMWRERSDISQRIRGKAGSLCNWPLVFGARGLLGINVVSVTPDLASCWCGIQPRGVQQNAFVNLIQTPCELWTGGKLADQTCGMQSSLFPCFGNRGGPWN